MSLISSSLKKNWVVKVACKCLLLLGFLLGCVCGFNIERYRLSLAWDKVEMESTKQFVKQYEKLRAE